MKILYVTPDFQHPTVPGSHSQRSQLSKIPRRCVPHARILPYGDYSRTLPDQRFDQTQITRKAA